MDLTKLFENQAKIAEIGQLLMQLSKLRENETDFNQEFEKLYDPINKLQRRRLALTQKRELLK